MNSNVIKHEPSTLLQKVRALSAPKMDATSLTSSQTNPRVRDILAEHSSADFYRTEYSTEVAQQLAGVDVSLGSLSVLSHVENPSLIDFRIAYGERKSVEWMLPHLSAVNAASGASNRMDQLALITCCRDIITAFPWITLAEFSVFCVGMRSLRYVEKRSDYVFCSDTVMRGLREFQRIRVDEIARYEREHRPEPDYSGAVSYEEYCRQTGKDVTIDPITGLANRIGSGIPPAHTREEIEAYKASIRQQ